MSVRGKIHPRALVGQVGYPVPVSDTFLAVVLIRFPVATWWTGWVPIKTWIKPRALITADMCSQITELFPQNSWVSNNRSGTIINFGEKFHPRQSYSTHPVYLNLKTFPPTPARTSTRESSFFLSYSIMCV